MRGFLAVALSAFSVLAMAGSAKADTTVFEDGFYFITEGTFDDVHVGAGAIVALTGTAVVNGDIEVTDDAWLSVNGITVRGDIEFEGATVVEVGGCNVGGDVEVTRTGGEPILGLLPSIFVFDNTIGGDLEVKKNNVNSISIQNNRIGGKLELGRNVSNFSTIANNLTRLKKSSKSK